MRKMIGYLLACLLPGAIFSQELFVWNEPASNMAAGSAGLRLNTRIFDMRGPDNYAIRLDPEIMVGVNKKIMVHGSLYWSDMYQPSLAFEGGSAYAKYRFYSSDDVHEHFRLAAFGRMSIIDNPTQLVVKDKIYPSDEIDLEGNNSGIMGGAVATHLINKTAFNASVSYLIRLNNPEAPVPAGIARQAANYSLSTGYLFLPRQYTSFRQTNLNLYIEVLASTALDKNAYYIDAAPALQFIFNSISRLDLSYRWQLSGDMQRLSEKYFLLRFEYNFLTFFKKA